MIAKHTSVFDPALAGEGRPARRRRRADPPGFPQRWLAPADGEDAWLLNRDRADRGRGLRPRPAAWPSLAGRVVPASAWTPPPAVRQCHSARRRGAAPRCLRHAARRGPVDHVLLARRQHRYRRRPARACCAVAPACSVPAAPCCVEAGQPGAGLWRRRWPDPGDRQRRRPLVPVGGRRAGGARPRSPRWPDFRSGTATAPAVALLELRYVSGR